MQYKTSLYAVLYAALTCKQNKRYRTSARLTKTRDRCSNM